jgi:hypothetical protein
MFVNVGDNLTLTPIICLGNSVTMQATLVETPTLPSISVAQATRLLGNGV